MDETNNLDQTNGVATSPESLLEKPVMGSTGDPPVPSGDPPDGTGRASQTKPDSAFATRAVSLPVGGSPTGAGGSPAPPVLQTSSEAGALVAGLPSGRDLLVGLGIIWGIDLCIGVAVALVLFTHSGQMPPSVLLITTLLSNFLAVGVSWWFVCKKYRQTFAQGFALAKVSRKILWVSVGIGIIYSLVALGLLSWLGTGESFLAKMVSTPEGLIAFSILAVVVPPFEEMYYRGFIFPILGRKIGACWAIVVVVVWFALVHSFQLAGDWIGIPIILVAGAIWTLQRHLTGSLVPSIVTHFTYNVCLSLLSLMGPK